MGTDNRKEAMLAILTSKLSTEQMVNLLERINAAACEIIEAEFDGYYFNKGSDELYKAASFSKKDEPNAEDLNTALEQVMGELEEDLTIVYETVESLRAKARARAAQWDIEEAEEQGE